MPDLESRVREVFASRADEASASSPERLARGIRREVRLRQAAYAACALFLVAAVGTGSILAVRQLGRSDRPAGPPRGTGIVTSATIELGTGAMDGGTWTFSLQRLPDSLCLGLEVVSRGQRSTAQTALCDEGPEEQRLAPQDSPGVTVDAWSFMSPLGDTTLVSGAVTRDVEAVEVRAANGEVVEATLVTPPDLLGVDFDVWFAVLSGERSGNAVGVNGSGNEMASVPFEPRTLNRLPGDLVPCGDEFGNVVGYLPIGEGGAMAGTWSAPGRPSHIGVDKIRRIARSPLEKVWSRVAAWWDSRPEPAADDQAYLDWWHAYPIHE